MQRTHRFLTAAVALTLVPSLAGSPITHAASYNGTAKTDFAKVTPASAIVYTTIQSTSAAQPINLARLGAIFGPAIQQGINGVSPGANTQQVITPLIQRFSQIFNGEYGMAVLPVTLVPGPGGKPTAKVHLLIDAGLHSGVSVDTVRGALAALGLTSKPQGSYRGATIASVNIGSLAALAGGAGAAAGAAPGAAGLPANSPISSTFYSAGVGNDAILASDLPTLKAALDSAAGAAPSIAASPGFTKTVSTLPTGRFLTVYLNIDTRQFRPLLGALGGKTATSALPKTDGTVSVALSVAAEKDGVLLSTSPQYSTGSFSLGTGLTPTPNALASLMPAGTLLYSSINNPAQLIRTAIVAAANSGTLASSGIPGGTNSIAAIEKMTGINLDQDVFSWMHGELSFAVLPVGSPSYAKDPTTAALTRFSIVAAIKVTNPAFVDAKLKKIISAANKQSKKKSDRLTLVNVPGPGGVTLHIATATPNGVGYTFYKGYLFIASALPADLSSVQKTGAGSSVGASKGYQAALAHFGAGPFGSIAYLDLTGIRKLAESYAKATGTNLTQYNAAAKPILSTFKSLAAVAYPVSHGGAALFINIGR